MRPTIHLPHGHVNGDGDQRHRHDQLPALTVHYPGNGGRVPVQFFVGALLPAVRPDNLAQVAVRIHETHGHQGQSQVAAFPDVVSGQEPQPPGIERQRPVQAVLQGKIGDGPARRPP